MRNIETEFKVYYHNDSRIDHLRVVFSVYDTSELRVLAHRYAKQSVIDSEQPLSVSRVDVIGYVEV